MTHEEEALISDPSIERWTIELERMLDGERDSSFERLGGPAEHVEMLLRLCEARAVARATFKLALETVVSGWQTVDRVRPESGWVYVSLIHRFTPHHGFGKIVDYLDRWGQFEPTDPVFGVGTGVDVHLRALAALERYIPDSLEPTRDSAAFAAAFRATLVKQFESESYGGFALGMLIMSGFASLDDADWQSAAADFALADDRPMFQHVIETLIGSTHHRRFPRGLLEFYAAILDARFGRAFWRVVGGLGAALPDPGDPIFEIPRVGRITLDFPRRHHQMSHIELLRELRGERAYAKLVAGSFNLIGG